MKVNAMRSAILFLMIVLLAGTLSAESFFLPVYETSKERGKAVIMTAIASIGLASFGLILRNAGDETDPPLYMTGIGFLAASFTTPMIIPVTLRTKRLERAMEIEQTFTPREKEGIVNEAIFSGMSEVAMRLAWGEPRTIVPGLENINLYRYWDHRSVYVQDGAVTEWY